jgi:GT2 family glycosyltransferase
MLGLLDRLRWVSALGPLRRRPAPGPRVLAGVSILVPARETPELLEPTLHHAEIARARTGEPSETIVVASGSDAAAFGRLTSQFPQVRWLFEKHPLDYNAAVEAGLKIAGRPWVYLLNSDMHLHFDAIERLLRFRRPGTFAIGSRIRMRDGSPTETNWTDFRFAADGVVDLVERDPQGVCEPRGCLYVGGGSGLFRTSLLRRFARRTRAYAPFYWEDVEWGVLAWRRGYHSIFCPSSEAVHSHRQTISRYYDEAEVSRVFERNRLLFQLRNLSNILSLEKRLIALDERSWREISSPSALLNLACARFRSLTAPWGEEALVSRWITSY